MHRSTTKVKKQFYFSLNTLMALFICMQLFVMTHGNASASTVKAQVNPPGAFIASIDTMKESQDTERYPLSVSEITNIVNESAKLNTTYITVDTHWEYTSYMKIWIDAIRASGRHVWFRSHPNQWEDNNGTTGLMTPQQYETTERQFILANPTFFQSGDIFDPCPEGENGKYWIATYGPRWTWSAPNTATHAFNAFLRTTSDVADSAFAQLHIQNVITTIRSTNSFFPTHPDVLEQATVNRFGRITIDSYPEGVSTDPVTATNARMSELKQIYNLWHVPIVIGEMGYCNNAPVNDIVQQAVLKSEFTALEGLSFVAGANYWVGAGSNGSGGYTYLLTRVNGVWIARPGAAELSSYYMNRRFLFLIQN